MIRLDVETRQDHIILIHCILSFTLTASYLCMLNLLEKSLIGAWKFTCISICHV